MEVGVRGGFLQRALGYELTAFESDFSTQIAVGSIAGGNTPLAVGETRYRGLEFATRFDGEGFGNFVPYASAASTWLEDAQQRSVLRAVATGAPIAGSTVGKRLAYAPEWTHTLRVGGKFAERFELSLEGVYVGKQYADFNNTELALANGTGQIGALKSYALLNLTLNYAPIDFPLGGFVALKNLADRRYIADRTRGILPGSGRQLVVGIDYQF
jgi:Fe(3+) dicitrate transport protein